MTRAENLISNIKHLKGNLAASAVACDFRIKNRLEILDERGKSDDLAIGQLMKLKEIKGGVVVLNKVVDELDKILLASEGKPK